MSLDPNDPWRPGATVGDLVLGERLGGGGMGEVFEAVHSGTGGRYALKTLLRGVDPELLLRFQREGEAHARVDAHPNVVRVHSSGQLAGRPYLVLEHVAGGDLDRRLREGPLPAREVVPLGIALARGLAHVHRGGILHRDLKPSNVLFDEAGTPKLVDFGLAHVAEAEALTRTGDLLGTPSYMAPEQARGERQAVDERTDVYGLGAVLYACLTGRPPHQAPTVLATLDQVLNAEPLPPSKAQPGIPAWLDGVVLACLAKAPARRLASAAALAEALEQRLDPGRSSRRKPGAALAAVACAGGLLALLLAALVPVGEPVPVAVRSGSESVSDASRSSFGRDSDAPRSSFGRESDASRSSFGRESESESDTEFHYEEPPDLEQKTYPTASLHAQRLLARSMAGDVEAMVSLGEGLVVGANGLPKDPVHARAWLRRAAEAGHASAMHSLGAMADGRGERSLALAWFRRSVGAGRFKSAVDLADCLAASSSAPEVQEEAYETYALYLKHNRPNTRALVGQAAIRHRLAGDDESQRAEAFRLYRESVKHLPSEAKRLEAAHVIAIRELAGCLIHGFGTEPDPEEALAWLEQGLGLGAKDARLFNLLAGLLADGAEGVEADPERAAKLYGQVIDLLPRLDGLSPGERAEAEISRVGLAKLLIRPPDTQGLDRAKELLLEVGEGVAGPWPWVRLGDRYRGAKRFDEAFSCYERIAKGSTDAATSSQAKLGRLLVVMGKAREGVPWLERSAAAGNPHGQFNLARCYGEGTGVPKDRGRQVELLRAAAAQGHGVAGERLRELGEEP